jgi:hypothetical protein
MRYPTPLEKRPALVRLFRRTRPYRDVLVALGNDRSGLGFEVLSGTPTYLLRCRPSWESERGHVRPDAFHYRYLLR